MTIPDDPVPIEQGIGVYFTRLVLGGIDFTTFEDRKFKTGPAWHRCARRRAVVVHRPGHRQHDLWPLVASPGGVTDKKQRGDGYEIARSDSADQTRSADGMLAFECWPRFRRIGADGGATQYPGWPVRVPVK